jgi:adenylate cyclase
VNLGTNIKSLVTVSVLAAFCVAAGIVLNEFDLGLGFRNLSYDLLLVARGHIAAPEAVMIYMDERSHDELKQPRIAAWDRTVHARMVDRLTEASAKAIVFDILFDAPAPPEKAAQDEALIAAMKRSGRVILAADNVVVAANEYQIKPPFDAVRDVAVAIASDEVEPGRDLIVRELPPNDQLPSMAWAAAAFTGARVTKERDPDKFKAWLNYYGPANFLKSKPFVDALNPAVVPDDFFRDKVVFIGANIMTRFSGERKDEYKSPYSLWTSGRRHERFISGVEIQTSAFLNLYRGDWLMRLGLNAERGLLAVCGLLSAVVLLRLRPLAATFTAIGFLALVAVGSYLAITHARVWFPCLIVAVQIGIALMVSIVINSVRLFVENRLFVQSLEMYLSPKLVKKFAADKERKLLKPGAVKQRLTILFSDIAGFTTITEGMDPDELCLMMNEYFQGAVGGCVHSTDGTIVKYIGDAIFAFWNAPDPQDDHAIRACEAALRFRELGKLPVRGRKLVTRIGLHTGAANVGNFGSDTRVDYTAFGENINLASRMEGLNKYLGTDVLITGDVKKEIGDHFITRYLGKFQLKGFERSVDVYELVAQRETGSAPAWHNEFGEAVRLFQQRDFDGATTTFERVLASASEENTTKFYLKHLKEVGDHPLPENWAGEVELKEK